MTERLFSVKEFSERTGVSTFTTRRLLKKRAVHFVRIGGRVLIPDSELRRVLDEGCGYNAQACATSELEAIRS